MTTHEHCWHYALPGAHPDGESWTERCCKCGQAQADVYGTIRPLPFDAHYGETRNDST